MKSSNIRKPRLNLDIIIDRANTLYSGRYTYWQDDNDPASHFRGYCSEHDHQFITTHRVHVYQKTPVCPKCVAVKRNLGSKRLSNEEFINRSLEAHNGFFSYEKTVYVNGSSKVCITCPHHGDFEQNAKNHMAGVIGCERCIGIVRSKETFIERSTEIHNSKYNYSKVVYNQTGKKVTIGCPLHGDFLQSPQKHLTGQGCQRCKADKNGNRLRLPKEELISRVKLIHGNRYDYSKSIWASKHNKIIIICQVHGEFEQTPTSHILGSNCPSCVRLNLGNSISEKLKPDFIKRAKEIHGDRYDYSIATYIRSTLKVNIICSLHGLFKQTPNAHLAGQGCPSCKKFQSKGELEWLTYLGVDQQYFQKWVMGDKNRLVDAYVPETNTVYEYYGNYWHGNPLIFSPDKMNSRMKMSYGQLYQRTINRENDLRVHGFNIISIWETDWKAFKKLNNIKINIAHLL